jgi:hypothetical protein
VPRRFAQWKHLRIGRAGGRLLAGGRHSVLWKTSSFMRRRGKQLRLEGETGLTAGGTGRRRGCQMSVLEASVQREKRLDAPRGVLTEVRLEP